MEFKIDTPFKSYSNLEKMFCFFFACVSLQQGAGGREWDEAHAAMSGGHMGRGLAFCATGRARSASPLVWLTQGTVTYTNKIKHYIVCYYWYIFFLSWNISIFGS
jgi:hypothetical protein